MTGEYTNDGQVYGDRQELFGRYLLRQRRKWGYTLEQLAEGLCSASELSRIESGERLPDKVFRDRLLARVGISPDLYEYFLFYDEYEPWKLRQQILNAIIRRDPEKAGRLLSEYQEIYGRNMEEGDEESGRSGADPEQENEEKQDDSENEEICVRLERQFILSMKAQLERMEGACEEALADLFQRALRQTVPQTEAAIRGKALSVHEIDLVLETLRCSCPEDAAARYQEILLYIERSHLDTLSRARVYPKAVCYFFYYGSGLPLETYPTIEEYIKRYQEALQLCAKGIELLRKSGRTYWLWELLKFQRCLLQKLENVLRTREEDRGAEELVLKRKESEERLQVLEQIHAEYGVPLVMGDACYLYIEKDVHCIGDVIRLRRNMLGMSRKQLCEGGCSEKTLSRLERNKLRTQRAIVRELLERLKLSAEYCRTELITDSVEAKERMDELRICIRNRETERADVLIREIKKVIPMKISLNRQTMLRYQTLNEFYKGTITKEEVCARTKEALEYTLPLEAAIADGEKYMTNGEILCVQNIASRSEEGIAARKRYIEMLREMYRPYEEEQMIPACINMYEVVMDCVASMLGDMGEYGESDAISRVIITESLRLRRLYGVHNSIYNILWNDEQQQKEGSLSERKHNSRKDLQSCMVLSGFCEEIRAKKFYRKKLLLLDEREE